MSLFYEKCGIYFIFSHSTGDTEKNCIIFSSEEIQQVKVDTCFLIIS